MRVKVSHVTNKWKPVKVGNESGDNLVIVTQGVYEPNVGKTWHLNVNSEQKNRDYILSIAQEGNILEVQIKSFVKDGKKFEFVDKYGPITLIKKAERGATAEDHAEN